MKRISFPFVAGCLIFMALFFISIGFASDIRAKDAPPKENFRVLDISERTYENGPSVAILLSAPLDPKISHDAYIRISNTKELLKSAWVLSEDGKTLYFPNAEPETKYSVTVLENLKSADGRLLNKRVTKEIITRKIEPAVSFASHGFLLPPKMTKGLPIVTVNVNSVYIEFFRLKPKGFFQFVNWRNTTGSKDYYKLSRAGKYAKMVFSGRFDLNAPKNKRTVCHIPVEDIEALKEPGLYLAIMRKPGQYEYQYQTTYFLVTDIGIHARSYAKSSIICTQSIKTGEPLSGVELRFYNRKNKLIGSGTTDETGIFRFNKPLSGNLYLIAAFYGKQMGILPLNLPAVDMSAFDLGKRPFRKKEVFIYSPRDLYRPGEEVVISALLRDYDGKPVKALPLKAALFSPDGKLTKKFTWYAKKLGTQGLNYYQTRIDIPKDAVTGIWEFKVFYDPSVKSPGAIYYIHVEEFLPERMKLALTSKNKYPAPSDDLIIDVSGRYLYGAPASGNEVAARVRVKAVRRLFDNLKEFEFGDIEEKDYRDYWDIYDLALDKEGELALEVPTRWEWAKSPLSVLVAVDLFESGGRPVTRAIDNTIWPAKALTGIRPLFKNKVAKPGPVGFEIVKANQKGEIIPAKGLIVNLIKEDRDYYWQYNESTGWEYNFTQKTYTYLTDSLDLDKDKPTSYSPLLSRGRYVISIKDPETGLITSLRFRVGSWWYEDRTAKSARPDKVVLTLDKPAYRQGDIIGLTITPPHEGQAIIAVEGDRPLWIKRFKIPAKGTSIEIPMLAGWDSHNLYISAVVFRPVEAKEKITPKRSVGLIHLPLDRSERKLALTIDAPEKVAPKGPVTVNLALESPPGENADPVFVTLAAVDVGILNITDFKTPDPFSSFFEKQRYDTTYYDVYSRIIENMDGNMAALRYGGDTDITGKKPPEPKVKLLSLFHGPVAFDKEGKAQVTFDFPDFNGRVRLMAVAFSKDKFGAREKEMTVAAPIVTQLAMPRFLAPDDSSFLTLDVHNLSGLDRDLEVLVSCDGFFNIENNMRNISLKDGEKTTLKFPVKAMAGFGTGTIKLNIKGENISLDREWKLGLRPGYPMISKKVFKVLDKGRKFSIEPVMTENFMPETLDISVKVSPRIPLDFQTAMKGLLSYPYGCLEQTTSRAWPLVFATPAAIEKFKLPEISKKERLKRLSKAIERLSGMQLASGGFGLWSKSSPEEAWLTVYVTDFLLNARDAGIDVLPEMISNGLKRIEKYIKKSPPLPQYMDNAQRPHLDMAIKSYAAFVLSRVKKIDLGSLRTLYDNHKNDTDSCLPLVHLGIALKNMGDTKRSADAIELACSKRPGEYQYWGDYGSLARDLAMSIAILAENRMESVKGFEKMLVDLDNATRNRRWLSTQEKFAIFRTGIVLSGMNQTPWQGSLVVKREEKSISSKGEFLIKLGPEDFDIKTAPPSFTSLNPEKLYVTATISGYPKVPPAADDSKISLLREIFDLKGKPVKRREFYVGELLIVHLKVASKKRIPDGLVADLLPAGFEIENQNLKHAFKIDDMKIDGKSIWELKEQAEILYEEYRDDRYVAAVYLDDYQVTHLFYLVRVVSPGTFSVPPICAESMYRPEIRGIGITSAPISVVNRKKAEQKPVVKEKK